MPDYTEDQDAAYELIIEAGGDATLTRKTGGTLDPVQDTVDGAQTETTKGAAVRLPASGGKIIAFDDKFKEDLKKGRITFFYIAGKDLAFDPAPGHTLTFAGKNWELAGATPIAPDGTTNIVFAAGAKEAAL